jgi:two-component system, LytTR family, response regulator
MDNTMVPEVLQMIGQVIPEGVSIAISDGRQYTYYQPSKSIDLKIVPGDQVRVGSATHKALENKGKVAHLVESRVFGIPYYGVSTPVIQPGNVESYITAIYSPQVMPIAIPEHRLPFLVGRDENGWLPIQMDEIMYISSNEGKTQLHTNNGAYINKFNMVELESLLSPGKFIRCHRSYFVNLEAIRFIHPHFHSTFILEMKDKQKSRVPVSQSYASSFRQLLGF